MIPKTGIPKRNPTSGRGTSTEWMSTYLYKYRAIYSHDTHSFTRWLASVSASNGVFNGISGNIRGFQSFSLSWDRFTYFCQTYKCECLMDCIFHELSNKILISFSGPLVVALWPSKVGGEWGFSTPRNFFASTYPHNFYWDLRRLW
jgi:hypothetical protein